LGQNFLRDPKILKKIVDFAEIKKTDTVLEIGPGEGTLTKILLERAGRVIAVEKDHELAEKLKERWKDLKKERKLEILEGDILKFPTSITKGHPWPESTWPKVTLGNYKLIGNIPYYITGEIFRKFLESEHQPQSITFVVQKEVAERIMARDKKESILSISIKAFGTPEYGGVIKAGSFVPAPKVDSAIIAIRNISMEKFKEVKIEKFFEILKKGFAHKRKLLKSNLSVEDADLHQCGIPVKARAEDLNIDDWICLSKRLI